MEPIDVRRFINNYTPADESLIGFEWNGLDDDDFEDKNLDFRELVIDAVVENLESAPIELVRDLFRAETRCSKEAWCIHGGIGSLAEHLLRHGDDRFIEDFLEGKFQSFDADLGTAFTVDLPLAEHLLDVVRSRLEIETDEARRERWKSGEALFQDWVNSCKSRPG